MDTRLRAFPPELTIPPPDFGVGGRDTPDNRWVPSRKEAVIEAVRIGQIVLSQAERDYALSLDEFLAWDAAYRQAGRDGLRAVKGLVALRPSTRYRVSHTDQVRPESVIPAGTHRRVSLPALKCLERDDG